MEGLLGHCCLLGDSEDSDQTVWRHRLVVVCAGCTGMLSGFLGPGLSVRKKKLKMCMYLFAHL